MDTANAPQLPPVPTLRLVDPEVETKRALLRCEGSCNRVTPHEFVGVNVFRDDSPEHFVKRRDIRFECVICKTPRTWGCF